MTNNERQRKFVQSQQANGLVKLVLWVPAEQAPDIQIVCHRLRCDRDLELGPLRNFVSGKMERKDKRC